MDKEKARVLCQQKADQRWMKLDERLPDIIRIGSQGPCEHDSQLVKYVFALMAFEVAEKRRARMLEAG